MPASEGVHAALRRRWAAKEAVMKTPGTAEPGPVGWRDIEICSARTGGALDSCCGARASEVAARTGGDLRRAHRIPIAAPFATATAML